MLLLTHELGGAILIDVCEDFEDVCEDFEDVACEPMPAVSLVGVPPTGGTVTDDLPVFVGVCPDGAGATGAVVAVDELVFKDSFTAALLCLEDAVRCADESAEDDGYCRRLSTGSFIMVSSK